MRMFLMAGCAAVLAACSGDNGAAGTVSPVPGLAIMAAADGPSVVVLDGNPDAVRDASSRARIHRLEAYGDASMLLPALEFAEGVQPSVLVDTIVRAEPDQDGAPTLPGADGIIARMPAVTSDPLTRLVPHVIVAVCGNCGPAPRGESLAVAGVLDPQTAAAIIGGAMAECTAKRAPEDAGELVEHLIATAQRDNGAGVPLLDAEAALKSW